MNNLIPVLLPAMLGLIAGISHGMVANSLDQPSSFGDTLSQSFQSGNSLRD